LEHYPKHVPSDIVFDNYNSLADLFCQACKRFEALPAFSNMGTVLSYKEVDELSLNFASFLQNDLKMVKGDRIAIMLPNVLQYPIALFGALRAGLVVVNTNPLYTSDEIAHQLNDAGVETLLVLSNFAHTVEKALPELKTLKNIIVTEMGDLFPTLKRILINSAVRYVKKMIKPYHFNTPISFRKALSQGAQKTFSRVRITLEDTAFLQYTGGTTGVAKGAILTHSNMVSNVLQARAWIAPKYKPGHEIIVTALPMYHIFSLTANCLTFLAEGALNILITNPRDIKAFVKEIANAKFTCMTGVNTLFNALLNCAKFRKNVDFSGLKFSLSGGMALQKNVADKWKEVTKTPILEAYGLTETSPAVTMNPHYLDAFNGSSGLPIPSTEVSIRNEQGIELAIEEEGELWVRGPQVMKGYWKAPEETAKVLTPDGWLKTGDIAKVDEKGFVYLVDRKKDMIIVSGFNVYPNEIEAVISHHPGVLEVGVIGIPCEHGGEKVKASIVRKDPLLSKDALRAYCKEHLTAYKVPKFIEFVEELPKTNVGKILRRALKEKADQKPAAPH
jgi:long-chain acyl-CoA synthetase